TPLRRPVAPSRRVRDSASTDQTAMTDTPNAQPIEIRHFIDGGYVASSRPLFPCHNPATGAVAAMVHEADAGIVDQAVQAAKRALKGPWAKFTDAERATVLRKLAQGI